MIALDIALGLSLVFLTVALATSALIESLASWRNWRGLYLQRGVRWLVAGEAGSAMEPSRGRSLAQFAYFHLQRFLSRLSFGRLTGGVDRSRLLEAALEPAEKEIIRKLLEHPFLGGSGGLDTRAPSYVPGNKFALALIEVLQNRPGGVSADLVDAIERLPDGVLRRRLSGLLVQIRGDLQQLQTAVEKDFDDVMNRVSGWYKRRTMVANFIAALIVAVGLNIDTFQITRTLWTDPVVRMRTAEAAAKVDAAAIESQCRDKGPDCAADYLRKKEAELAKLGLPVGWKVPDWATGDTPGTWLSNLFTANVPLSFVNMPLALAWLIVALGWIATAMAGSLGAPFWFDAIAKISSIRATGVRPAPAEPAASPSAPVPPGTAVPPLPTTASAFERQLTRDDIIDVQSMLGLSGVQVTGVLDKPTRELIQLAQQRLALPTSGQLTETFIRRLEA